MGAETHVRGWGRRTLALFQVLALVALVGLQGAVASDAAAEKNRERPDVGRECSASEAEESLLDQNASDDGQGLATEFIACRDDADSDTEVDEEADDHETKAVDETEPDEPDNRTNKGDDHEPDEADDHESRAADEPESDEADEVEGHEPDEGGDDHEAGEPDEAEQPDDAVEPGAGAGDIPEAEPVGSTEPDQDQGGQDTDSPPAEAAQEPQNPTGGAEDSSGKGHPDADSEGAGSGTPKSGDPGFGGPERDSGASRSASGEPGSSEEARNLEFAPAAATATSGYNLAGSFSTAALLDTLPSRQTLRARKRVPEAAPFIIAGPASWTDTWGAPRSGPGSLARRHEGQDVFCRYRDPVLASERGYVEFDEGGLGGKVARVHRIDGSYWYYAHLSAWNTGDFSSGDQVDQGDVIGYCGNSGNAAGSPPHVHFGFYGANGHAINPMIDLVHWLRAAERNPLVASLDNRDSNSDALGDLTLKSSLEDVLLQRIPRLDGTGDAFGDSRAGLENPRNHQPLAASSTLPQAVIAVVAIATMFLWGGLSVRGAFSSA